MTSGFESGRLWSNARPWCSHPRLETLDCWCETSLQILVKVGVARKKTLAAHSCGCLKHSCATSSFDERGRQLWNVNSTRKFTDHAHPGVVCIPSGGRVQVIQCHGCPVSWREAWVHCDAWCWCRKGKQPKSACWRGGFEGFFSTCRLSQQQKRLRKNYLNLRLVTPGPGREDGQKGDTEEGTPSLRRNSSRSRDGRRSGNVCLTNSTNGIIRRPGWFMPANCCALEGFRVITRQGRWTETGTGPGTGTDQGLGQRLGQNQGLEQGQGQGQGQGLGQDQGLGQGQGQGQGQGLGQDQGLGQGQGQGQGQGLIDWLIDYIIHCPSLSGSYAGVLYNLALPPPVWTAQPPFHRVLQLLEKAARRRCRPWPCHAAWLLFLWWI